MRNTNFNRVRDDTFVNHLEGSQHLSNKGTLTRLLNNIRDCCRSAVYYPRCHSLRTGIGTKTSKDKGAASIAPVRSDPAPALGEATGTAVARGVDIDPSNGLESSLASAAENLIRDVAVQVVVGALRKVVELACADAATTYGAAGGGSFSRGAGTSPTAESRLGHAMDLELVSTCVRVAERWAQQLEQSSSVPAGLEAFLSTQCTTVSINSNNLLIGCHHPNVAYCHFLL